MAEVSGHDTEAHGHTQYLRHAIRTLADLHSPGNLLGWLNVAFQGRLADFATNRFASVFLAAFDGWSLTYASSGHGLELLMRASGRHVRVPSGSAMLGIKAAKRFKEKSIAVAPGDWLVLATEAITTAQNAEGVPFGASGVARKMLSAIRSDVDDPAAAILDGARAHGAVESINDAAVLCIRFPS
jgi:serine phosphatase RsbU (regulator of sigma subunit)